MPLDRCGRLSRHVLELGRSACELITADHQRKRDTPLACQFQLLAELLGLRKKLDGEPRPSQGRGDPQIVVPMRRVEVGEENIGRCLRRASLAQFFETGEEAVDAK